MLGALLALACPFPSHVDDVVAFPTHAQTEVLPPQPSFYSFEARSPPSSHRLFTTEIHPGVYRHDVDIYSGLLVLAGSPYHISNSYERRVRLVRPDGYDRFFKPEGNVALFRIVEGGETRFVRGTQSFDLGLGDARVYAMFSDDTQLLVYASGWLDPIQNRNLVILLSAGLGLLLAIAGASRAIANARRDSNG